MKKIDELINILDPTKVQCIVCRRWKKNNPNYVSKMLSSDIKEIKDKFSKNQIIMLEKIGYNFNQQLFYLCLKCFDLICERKNHSVYNREPSKNELIIDEIKTVLFCNLTWYTKKYRCLQCDNICKKGEITLMVDDFDFMICHTCKSRGQTPIYQCEKCGSNYLGIYALEFLPPYLCEKCQNET